MPFQAYGAHLWVSLGWAVVVGWLIFRASRQQGHLPQLAPGAPRADVAPSVTVIVPARDEAVNIAACLKGLCGQSYPGDRLRITVVDDHSSDATLSIAQAIQRTCPQVAVLRSPDLPPNWTGKSHACWVGAHAADTDWLCFIDADVRVEPDLIASAIAAATADGIDLLSLMPRHELGSFAERLVLPTGFYLMAFRQDLGKLQAPDGDDAAATGLFLLIRRGIYESTGGHSAVRNEICEDVGLARVVKRAGHRVALHDGQLFLTSRMYRGWRTLWPGLAKNAVETLGGIRPAALTIMAAVVLAWAALAIPLLDAIGCQHGSSQACFALLPAMAGTLAASGLHLAGAHHFGIPVWYGFLFPVGYTAGALIVVDSIRWRLLGRVSWKGRTYP